MPYAFQDEFCITPRVGRERPLSFGRKPKRVGVARSPEERSRAGVTKTTFQKLSDE